MATARHQNAAILFEQTPQFPIAERFDRTSSREFGYIVAHSLNDMTGASRRSAGRLVALLVAAVAIAACPGAGAQETKDRSGQAGDSAGRPKARGETPAGAQGEADQPIEAERARLNAQLLETGRLIQRSEATLSAIEARLGELEEQKKMTHGSLAQRHEAIGQLLAALQRMGRNPPPVMVTRREDALEMVRSAMLLSRLFPALKAKTDELAAELRELLRVTNTIQSEGRKLKAETDRLNRTQEILKRLIAEKRLTTERQAELDDVRKMAAEIADIARNVTDLGDLITRTDKTIAERTKLGAYDRE
ncbi:MAG: murein hydrolase activator EnvC family protein, partial [Hyphomicrobiaceae bacterium]